MSDEITDWATAPFEPVPDTAPAVEDPHNSTVEWPDLTDSQKLDIIHMKIDALSNNVTNVWTAVDWTAKTIQGLATMAASLKPTDILKNMMGGKR